MQFLRPHYTKIMLTLTGLIGLIGVIQQRWVCDDAFISFRYARNAARGLGLVYNAGEKVEGYTNFLWTVLFIPVHFFNLDPIQVSYILGACIFIISFYLIFKIEKLLIRKSTVMALADNLSEKPTDSKNKTQFQNKLKLIPVASMAWALNTHVQIFASSGLETGLYTCLVLAGTLLLLQSRRSTKSDSIGFLFLALAAMTRPDAILIYGLACIWLVLTLTKNMTRIDWQVCRHLIFSQWSLLLVYLPYYALKYLYYGWPLPNTWYAKSGHAVHYEQGIRYLLLFMNSYYVFYLLPVFFLVWLGLYFRHKIRIPKTISSIGNTEDYRKQVVAVFWLLVLPAVLTILYYIRMGGGFMFARFFVPSIPALYILLGLGVYLLAGFKKKYSNQIIIVLALIIIGSTVLWLNPYRGMAVPVINGIVAENKIYTRKNIHTVRQLTRQWTNIFRKYNIRIAIGGSEAALAYYLDPHYVLEAATGLTDAELAHKPVSKRGQPGHEKAADLNFLYKRKIHLHLHGAHLPDMQDYQILRIEGMPPGQRIISWNLQTMQALTQISQFQFLDFPRYLDSYIWKLNRLPPAQVSQDLQNFEIYYFNHNHDMLRYNKIKNYAKQTDF